ncbi:MAG: pyridoxal phosphate-dependent aminotransferase [Clostridia bacterium]|nr:pyridoxal phosphate-dependent aminotransferase [Clostridia bacterium]
MATGVSKRAGQIAPSMTLKIDAKAKEMKQNGLDVIGFGAGEPDFDTPASICDAAREALLKGMTRYTPVSGTLHLREAICKKLSRDNGLDYKPGEIIVSNGAKHSLSILFQCILNDGDEVIIPTPCWVSYPEMVRMAGGVPVYAASGEADNFVPTAASIQSAVTARTKAFMLTSPSNPCGSVWTRDQLAFLLELAEKNDFYIVSDEIYENFLYDGLKHQSIASLTPGAKHRTLLVNGVSKSYAMTGWRIGYVAGPADVIKAMDNYQSQSASNANSIAQYAAAEALLGCQDSVEGMRDAFEKRRNTMVQMILEIPGLSCQKPDGAFYVMLNIKGILGRYYGGKKIDTSMAFADALLENKHVAVVPGIAFEAEGYCRLSYAISERTIQEGLTRIAAFVSAMTQKAE